MDISRTDAAAEPLARFRLFETGDLDDAREFVGRTFCPHRLDAPGRGARLRTVHNHARGRSLSLNFLRYGATVDIEPGELTDFYLVQIPLRGTAVILHGGKEVLAGAETASVLNPTLHTRMTWFGDCEKLLLQIDRAALQGLAETLAGERLRRPVVFRADVALGSASMRKWVRLLHACRVAAEAGGAFGELASPSQALVEEGLLLAFLEAQESNLSPLLEAARPACACPRHVKRARDYMHARLAEPITMAEVAAAAGCSLRTLQAGFRQTFGVPPLQYLLSRRLALAHFALLSCARDVTVADEAEHVGYDHLGRFAGGYRGRFGRAPSVALREAQGRRTPMRFS